MKRDPSGYWKMLGMKVGDLPGHPFRGNQYGPGAGGETTSAGDVESTVHWHPSHEMSERMLNMAKSGGFTIDIQTEEPVESGISVGEYPERSGKFDADEVKASDIQDWLDKNKDILTSDPAHLKLGGWLETNGKGTVWLDIVRIYPESEKESARQSGMKHNQKCIADLAAIKRGDWDNAFIDCGGTGEAKAVSKRGKKGTYMMFDVNVSAQKILDTLLKNK